MLDLQKCSKKRLCDLGFIFEILSTLPEVIGMTKITQPYVFPYSGLVPEDCGITGFVVIAESHISVHTFSDKDFVFVDVFSCKGFDISKAEKYLVKAFCAKKVVRHFVERGVNFPR